jgi:hypothetical protein
MKPYSGWRSNSQVNDGAGIIDGFFSTAPIVARIT